jgi:hypothetical protein
MARKLKSKSKAPVSPYQTYILRIDSWTPTYGFSAAELSWPSRAYSEHSELKLTGVYLAPAKLAGKTGGVILLGDRDKMLALEEPPPDEPPQPGLKPMNIGRITVRDDCPEFFGSIPIDAFWGLISALASGTLQFVNMYGERLRRGRAKIQSISVYSELDPDDLQYELERG